MLQKDEQTKQVSVFFVFLNAVIFAITFTFTFRGHLSGQVSRIPYGQTLKDRATQLLIKYKSGALVTQ